MRAEPAEALEAAVRAAEEGTDAEIVVVVAARSDRYYGVAMGVGLVFAWFTYLFALWVPFDVPPLVLLIELPLAALVGAWLGTSDAIVRMLPLRQTTATVDRSASAAFYQEAVHATAHRNGVLVYQSLAERRVRVLPDVGLLAVLPPARWRQVEATGETAGLSAALAELGTMLGAVDPQRGGPRVELADAPRIRT